MADDPNARIAQFEAELRQARAEVDALRAQRDGLADEILYLRPALNEALEQQTATAEILRAIASSPIDLQRVLHDVAQSAMRHSRSTGGGLCLREGDTVRTVALAGEQPRVPESHLGEVNPVSIS